MSFIERANSKRRICARQWQLVINQWMIFPDADQQNKFIFRIHCNHSKIDDNNSHTCISSYTSLRAYLTVCMHGSQHLKYVFVTQREGGTRFETATLMVELIELL